jgi:hypothetical protein
MSNIEQLHINPEHLEEFSKNQQEHLKRLYACIVEELQEDVLEKTTKQFKIINEISLEDQIQKTDSQQHCRVCGIDIPCYFEHLKTI